MNDDLFLTKLRDEAASLRYEPRDAATWTRLAATIRARVAEPAPTVGDWLVRWFRPVGAAMVTLALAATLGSAWLVRTLETSSGDTFAADSSQISMLDGVLSNGAD